MEKTIRGIFGDLSSASIGDNITPAEAANSISIADAFKLFDELASREDIIFGNDRDGWCAACAHILCRGMEEAGLIPKKAWAIQTGKQALKCVLPDGRTRHWDYHIAPALPVRMEDGTVKNLVFDPGLFDGPVSLQEWGRVMRAMPEMLQIAAFGAAPVGHKGTFTPKDSLDNPDAFCEARMTEYLDIRSRTPRVVFPVKTLVK